MKKLNKKVKVLLLTITLIIISFLVILINGKTYTLKINNLNDISNIEKINIKIEDNDIVKCIEKKIENNVIKIKLESISKGKTFVEISHDEKFLTTRSIYVHNFGIITYNAYLGKCNGDLIIPISIIIVLIYILYLLIILYKQSQKENIYQYKNIAYLGMIIFIIFDIIYQLLALNNYSGLSQTIDGLLNAFSFAIYFFPIIFLASILVIISNISLIRKEGININNILGIILGIFLCFTTILPEIMNNLLYSATWIDIHNQNGIELYLYNFTETVIFISVTYIECILAGTIIMGLKSAKRIPKFDKDCIIILGCQIKKDGTLTNLLKGRVNRAIEFSKMQKVETGKDIIFVPSGGKGSDEIISEAQAMKNYLIEQGIKEENILIEDKSKNTFENIKFSSNIIKENIKDAKIAFSTTNYHVFRAGNIATSQNLYIEGIGAKTKSYFWINAFIREFIATIFYEKKKHIAVMCSIVVFDILMIILKYLNNNI